jgi:hypothetical protein
MILKLTKKQECDNKICLAIAENPSLKFTTKFNQIDKYRQKLMLAFSPALTLLATKKMSTKKMSKKRSL